MWRAVIALAVVGLGLAVFRFGGTPVNAQGGFSGEAGPEVPLPAIVHGGGTDGGPPAAKKPNVTPGLPVKKPRKPPPRTRASTEKKKTRKKQPATSSQSERERYLCRALQTCRNKFIRCKAKIKHPDQSEAWSIAKEECGAHYKTCVEKDFKGGEWLLTRWFYFQKLECG